MPNITPSFKASVTLPLGKKITRTTITDETIEHTHTLNAGCCGFFIQATASAEIYLSFNVGESNTDYWTIHANNALVFDEANFNNNILYYRVSKKCIIEVMEVFT